MIKIDGHLMPSRNRRFFLGFSGGVDSLAAAHFLDRGGWQFTLLHVQHFRTPESEDIAYHARCAARNLGLPITVRRCPSEAQEGTSKEAQAYKVRNRVWEGLEAPVVLCNHLNDLAEGYFMNCQQGFPDRVPLVAVNGLKIRPFLKTKKTDFYRYLEGKKLTHLIVPDGMLSLRGKLRTSVFPVLGDDWTSAARKLFIDTGRIYGTE